MNPEGSPEELSPPAGVDRRASGWGVDTTVRVRTRSECRAATTQATMPPQSWPTRSKVGICMVSAMASTSATSRGRA